MAQLRQFFFRSVDPEDKLENKKDWEEQRGNYETDIKNKIERIKQNNKSA